MRRLGTRALRSTLITEIGIWRICRYAPNERMPAHRHDHPQLSITLAGRHRETHSNGVDDVFGFQALLKPRGYRHENDIGPEGALLFSFSARAHDWPLATSGLRPAAPVIEPWRRIARELIAAPVPDVDLVSDLTCAMAETLEQDGDGFAHAAEGPTWLRRAKEALSDSTLSTSEVASEIGVHRVHLSRTFRQYYGLAMTDYRRGLRLARAVDALADQTHSLSDAAATAGYADQAHMTREMKREWGWTPAVLRAALLQNVPKRAIKAHFSRYIHSRHHD